jgi:hypothetical protein
LRWHDLLEFIDELFLVKHIRVGMKGESSIGELLFPSFEYALNEKIGYIIIGEAFDNVLHIFEYTSESGCIIECEKYCYVGNGGFNVHTFGAAISYF